MTDRLGLGDVRRLGQPPEIMSRRSAEHWLSGIYARSVSPYATLAALRVGLKPNHLTSLMILTGLAAALVVSQPGIPSSLVAFALIQVFLILDCSDGELARVTGETSASGVYLDRVGHYLVDASIFVAFGFRVGAVVSAWVILGMLGAILALLGKATGDLVQVARATSGLPPLSDSRPVDSSRVAAGRRLFELFPIHRATGAIEALLLIALATVADSLTGLTPQIQRALLVVLVVLALLILGARLMSALTSNRLR